MACSSFWSGPSRGGWLLWGMSVARVWRTLTPVGSMAEPEAAQLCKPSWTVSEENSTDSMRRGRRLFWVGAVAAYGVIYAAPMISWYDWRTAKGWRWFDDGREWKQMDKLGHVWTTYHLSAVGAYTAQRAGYSRSRALWIGLGLAWLYQATIEVADGFFPKWGASAWDLWANTIGSGAFWLREGLLHQTAWDIGVKFSFHPTPYAQQRPDLLGRGAAQILKDYNGQTYWLVLFHRRWPMGLALGHGATGLLGGYGTRPWTEIQAQEQRRWMLSLEPYWPFFFQRPAWGLLLLASVKLPLPTLVYENRQIRLAAVYF